MLNRYDELGSYRMRFPRGDFIRNSGDTLCEMSYLGWFMMFTDGLWGLI